MYIYFEAWQNYNFILKDETSHWLLLSLVIWPCGNLGFSPHLFTAFLLPPSSQNQICSSFSLFPLRFVPQTSLFAKIWVPASTTSTPPLPEPMRVKQLVKFWMASKKGTSKGKGKEVVIIEATLGDGWKSSKCSGIQHPLSCQGVHSSALRNCSVAVRFRSPYESISELSRLSNVDLEFLLVISFVVFFSSRGFKHTTWPQISYCNFCPSLWGLSRNWAPLWSLPTLFPSKTPT